MRQSKWDFSWKGYGVRVQVKSDHQGVKGGEERCGWKSLCHASILGEYQKSSFLRGCYGTVFLYSALLWSFFVQVNTWSFVSLVFKVKEFCCFKHTIYSEKKWCFEVQKIVRFLNCQVYCGGQYNLQKAPIHLRKTRQASSLTEGELPATLSVAEGP